MVKATQQFVVLAHFSDGHVEDATRWSKYTSVNSAVASVDERGKVAISGAGEGAGPGLDPLLDPSAVGASGAGSTDWDNSAELFDFSGVSNGA